MAQGGRVVMPIAELRALVKRALDHGARAERVLSQVMDEAEAKSVEITPVDTGFLEGSTVVGVSRTSQAVRGELAFAADYAAQVHELPPDRRGPRTREKAGNEFGRAGPKYLERVLRGFPFGNRFAELFQKDLGRRPGG